MNGYLGTGRYQQKRKYEDLHDVHSIMAFAEQNSMWNIRNRTSYTESLDNNNMVSMLWNTNSVLPTNPISIFATFHVAPSEDIQIEPEATVDYVYSYVQQSEPNPYPNYGLCRGRGNVMMVDGHVESFDYMVDTHSKCWPLSIRETPNRR